MGWNSDQRYLCQGCDSGFKRVSGLFQHIETAACDWSYQEEPITELRDDIELLAGHW